MSRWNIRDWFAQLSLGKAANRVSTEIGVLDRGVRAIGVDASSSVRAGDLLRHNASNMTAEVVLADADGMLLLFRDGSTANFLAREIARDWKLAWSSVPRSQAHGRVELRPSAVILPFVRPGRQVVPFRPHSAA